MKVHYGFEEWKNPGRTVASLGNYDGVHLGHQVILKMVAVHARDSSVPSVVVTFDPVPKKILYPETAPLLIQTLDQRLRSMELLGIDHTIVVAFNREFSHLSPEEFVRGYLVGILRIKEFIVGMTFSFGYQKKGNVDLLKRMGLEHDFVVHGIPGVQINNIRISSTLIRRLIQEGRVEEVQQYLGSPYALSGTVEEGEKLGGKLGIPTANLKVENELQPGRGVFVTRAVLGEFSYPSVTNVGVRPTVGGTKMTVESHLLKYSGELYGREMEIQFLKKLRDERLFSSVEELKSQIHADIKEAESYWGS